MNQLQDKLETQSRKAAECEAAIEEASEKTNKDGDRKWDLMQSCTRI